MKKAIYIFICLTAGLTAKAQYYSFAASTQTYTEISGPDLTDTTLTDYISFLPDYPFRMFGKSGMTSYTVGVATGYMVASSPQYGFAFDPMMGTRFRKIAGQSSISIKESTVAGDTQLVIQWKNIGLIGHPDSEFLNFQLRVHLGNEKVDYHYGPSNYVRTTNDSAFMDPANTGPEVMVVLLYPDFSNYYDFNTLSGSPENPVYSQNYARMTGIPAANTLYSFNKKGSTGLNKYDSKKEDVSIYPNPSAGHKIQISSTEPIASVKIYSLKGELLITQNGGGEVLLPESSQLFYAEITLINGEQMIKKIMTF